LLSKIPLKSTQSLLVLAPGKYNATIQGRTLLAEITLSGQPVTVLIGHLPAPFTPEMDETAQLQLSVWAEQRSKFQKNLLVAGDLNTTPWSRGFNSFLQQANLQNSQHQFGVQASWPVIIPIPFTASYINIPPVLYQLFGISIDHVLVSPTLSVLSRKMDTEAGSDHLPVIIEFGLKDGV
jgi:endonuclease/exonuclease/phosphatase (EEP) superfamily protein YafD